MNQPLPDDEERERAKALFEQTWLGPIFLALLAIGVLALLVSAASGGEVKLAWDASAGATEYRVWRGIECIATVQANEATVTVPDEPVTLTVTARNSAGESAHSAPLPLVAVTVQESVDLKAWAATRTIHREKTSQPILPAQNTDTVKLRAIVAMIETFTLGSCSLTVSPQGRTWSFNGEQAARALVIISDK